MIARAAPLLLLAAVGCTTTTYAQRGGPTAQGWLTNHASSDVQAELAAEPPGDHAAIAIDARSLADIRFVAADASVVPIEQVRKVTAVRHGLGAMEGAAFGGGAGMLSGLIYGASRPLSAYEQSGDCALVCNHSDAAKLGAVLFGALGLVIGTATGAIVGARDDLDLR